MTKILSFFFAILSFFLGLFGKPTYPHGNTVNMDKFELTWSDEFDSNSVDADKWGAGWWPAVPTSVRRGGYWNTRLASVSDGALHIATKYIENGLDGFVVAVVDILTVGVDVGCNDDDFEAMCFWPIFVEEVVFCPENTDTALI